MELPIYNALIRLEIINRARRMIAQGITVAGYVDRDQFLVEDQLDVPEERSHDEREKQRGRNCTTQEIDRLTNVLWNLEIMPTDKMNLVYVPVRAQLTTRDAIIAQILTKTKKRDNLRGLESWSMERLHFYNQWVHADKGSVGITKAMICDMIKTRMKERGILEGYCE